MNSKTRNQERENLVWQAFLPIENCSTVYSLVNKGTLLVMPIPSYSSIFQIFGRRTSCTLKIY